MVTSRDIKFLLKIRTFYLLQLQVTRVGFPYNTAGDTPFLLLPVVYDIVNNVTNLIEKKDSPNLPAAVYLAFAHFKRFADYSLQPNECSLFPTVRDFLMNFTLPSEPQPQVLANFKILLI